MPLWLSNADVNRYLLHKQHLTPDSRGEDVATVVREVGPIRATPAITPYVSLWARMRHLDREQVDRALYVDRSLVRVSCLHARLYIVLSEELPAYYQATRTLLQGGLAELGKLLTEASPEGPQTAGGGPARAGRSLASRVLEVVSVRGPLTVAEVAQVLPELNRQIDDGAQLLGIEPGKLGSRLIPAMCAEGLLVRTQPRGGWRSNLYCYATLSSWLGNIDLSALSPSEALRQVVWAYVVAYGPVTIGDLSQWLGGFPRHRVRMALTSFGGRLDRVQFCGIRGDYYVAKRQLGELLDRAWPGADDAERSVCLLPPRDSYSMAYGDVGRFWRDQGRAAYWGERVYDRVGESMGTVWVDGFIEGTWGLQVRAKRIIVRLFEAADSEMLATVYERARDLASMLGFTTLDVDIRADVAPAQPMGAAVDASPASDEEYDVTVPVHWRPGTKRDSDDGI